MAEPDIKRIFRESLVMWTTGDLAPVDEFVASDYVGHVAAGDGDREGLKQRIREFHQRVSDARFIVEDQLEEGAKVVTRMTLHATDPVSHQPVTLMGINIARFRTGKMVEEWNTWETLRQ
jgi:predicted ester cyclase